MARPLRIEFAGAIYHITSRGNAREAIFFDDVDRISFLDLLLEVNKKYKFITHAYCLMDNHYHIVIETALNNLSKGMRQLNGVYTQRFNKRHRRVGHIFQGRFKAVLVQKDAHLLELIRYVILNPVRAHLVSSPDSYRWSSYLLKIKGAHLCLTTDFILSLFGKYPKSALRKYRQFIQDGIDKEAPKIKSQLFIGDDDFVKELASYLDQEDELTEIPRSQRYAHRPSLIKLFNKRQVENKAIRNKRIKEAVLNWGYSQKEVADVLGLHYSTVSVIVNK